MLHGIMVSVPTFTDEEFPRYSAKELRDHFERTIEEAASHKPIKVISTSFQLRTHMETIRICENVLTRMQNAD